MARTIERIESDISDAEVDRFEEEGAVCLRRLFDREWIERMRAALAEIVATSVKKQGPFFTFSQHCIAFDYPELMAFVQESPAAAIARRMMRARTARFYFDQVFIKEPGMRAPSPWHHDQSFWPVQGHQICSVWLALDPVTKASSGLEYVAGSHCWGKFFKPPNVGGRVSVNGFEEDDEMPDIAADPARYRLLNWDMEPGDCLVHHGLTVHGAGGNTTLDVRRRALATRWVGEDATYRAGGGDALLLVDGLETGDPLPPDRFPIVAA